MKNAKYYFLGALILTTCFTWYAIYAETRSGLTISFLDIGQGDAIFIEAPSGNQILIDGGRNKKILQELSKVMPFYDRSIDMVIATHPDQDHIGGLPEVLKRFKVGLVMEPGVESSTNIYKEFERVIENKNIKKLLAREGMRIKMGGGAYIDILFPTGDVIGWDTNTASIVTKVNYGKTSFLLTGDSPKKIENYLTSIYKKGLKVNVLKAGHHGSKTSTSENFLGYTDPEYVVISAGRDNSYGHPHKEVMNLLEKFNILTLQTSIIGTIKFKSNGEKVFVK